MRKGILSAPLLTPANFPVAPFKGMNFSDACAGTVPY
jgi:hypothetical protein